MASLKEELLILDIPNRYKQIDGFESYYVTDIGDVYSYRGHNGWQGLRKMALRGRNNPKRYLQVVLSSGNSRKYMQVHRLVATYFCDGWFPGAVVNHKDCDIHNNHYTNLEWITQRENIHLSYEHTGMDQTRNYGIYELVSPSGVVLGVFKGKNAAARYLTSHGFDVSESSLTKYHVCNGYTLRKLSDKPSGSCNDYPFWEYTPGETPDVEAPSPL